MCLINEKFADLPPLQMPLGSVDQPQPCPHGKAQAKDPFGDVSSCVLFFRIATAASLFTLLVLLAELCLSFLRADTSEFVAAGREW